MNPQMNQPNQPHPGMPQQMRMNQQMPSKPPNNQPNPNAHIRPERFARDLLMQITKEFLTTIDPEIGLEDDAGLLISYYIHLFINRIIKSAMKMANLRGSRLPTQEDIKYAIMYFQNTTPRDDQAVGKEHIDNMNLLESFRKSKANNEKP